jgi:hypothetical protein
MKKKVVLFLLFIMPIVAYLFFASGINNFTRLPVLTPAVKDFDNAKDISGNPVSLNGKITVLGFPGLDVYKYRGALFNMQQRIFDRYHEFEDLQFVTICPTGTEKEAALVHEEIAKLYKADNWHFVVLPPDQITGFYKRLKLKRPLDGKLATPNAFIIDKERNLRGRKGQEYKEGYDTFHPSDLNNKMLDDFKVILYEYKAALKKNHNATKELDINEK